MKTKGWLVAWAVPLLTATGAATFAADSVPVLVDSDLRSAHWTTAFTNVLPLACGWNTNASSARLDIAGMGGTFTTNVTGGASNILWRAFVSDVPSSEDVYTLTLTVYTNGNGIAEVVTSRLAVVKGAFGATAVNAVSNSPAWSKVRSDTVIPYDASWADGATNAASSKLVIAKVGGAVQTNAFAGVAGYAGWKIRNSGWGYGTFDLTLSFIGATNVWTAELIRPMDGTAVSVR
jgi:hypothetical protein